ncbi:MAG: tetratricopeptide repeat protein [Candidatus Latescibacterota bacterium]|jgi:tetratricopeptide (TPR) repeat protein
MLRVRPWWAPLSVAVLTATVYLNSLDNGFHYDDSHSILENPHLRSLTNLPRILVDPQTFSREPAMAMYRPVLVTTYALNYWAGGYSPAGFRVVNLGIHVLAAVLVFHLLGLFLGSRFLAWWGAMLFGLHPVHSQVVNYISSRSESLATVGVLAALGWVLANRSRPVAALTAYAGALLTKPSAVVALPLLAVGRWGPIPGRLGWRRQLPFWVVTAAYVALILANRFLTRSLSQEVRPYGEQLLTQAKAVVYYLWLAAMPVRLSVEHGLADGTPGLAPAVASLLLLASAVGLAWRGRHACPWGILGVGWFLGGLSVTLLVPLNMVINEHRLYLASIGLLLATLGPLAARPFRRVLGLVGAVLLCGLALLTWQRNPIWRDELSLWQDAAAKAPGLFRAQSNLGLALYEAGQAEEALVVLQRALRLNPRYAKSWNNLGLVHEELGHLVEAEEAYTRALVLDPELAGARANLGRLCLTLGRDDEAREHLERARSLDPYAPEPRIALGLLHQRAGRLPRAVDLYLEAARVDPGKAEAWNNLGLAYAELGRGEEGLAALERAARLRPGYEEAEINLQIARQRAAGVPPQSIYRALLAAHPDRAELWEALARALEQAGDWRDAAAAYQEGLAQVRSGHRLPLLKGLASALAAAGRLDEALVVCREVVSLAPEDLQARQNLARLEQAAARAVSTSGRSGR